MNKPKFITFTGADDAADLDAIVELSARYPIEWGILFSPARHGKPRYPTLDFVNQFTAVAKAKNLVTSAHLCGGYTVAALHVGRTEVDDYVQHFHRAQINTAEEAPNMANVRAWSSRVGVSPIMQCRGAFPPAGAIAWLFDISAGEGIRPQAWPAAEGFCGYAGGIGPDNVAEVARSVGETAKDFWLDMESGIRDADGKFSIERCRAVCEAVYG